MANITEATLQSLYDQANLASNLAQLAVGTPYEGPAQDSADEAWQQFHSAMFLWQERNPESEWNPPAK